jgi:hypothetical protein
MRLLTIKPFSATSLKSTMRFTWAPAKEVIFCDIEENSFLVQASYLGDWKKITKQGPWIFCDHSLLIEKYDGSCWAALVALHRIHAWVHILDVLELFRKKELIWGLTKSIGEVIMVDMNGSGGDFFSESLARCQEMLHTFCLIQT